LRGRRQVNWSFGGRESDVKRVAGAFMLLLGLILVCWVGYNLPIERRSPLPALSLRGPAS